MKSKEPCLPSCQHVPWLLSVPRDLGLGVLAVFGSSAWDFGVQGTVISGFRGLGLRVVGLGFRV